MRDIEHANIGAYFHFQGNFVFERNLDVKRKF